MEEFVSYQCIGYKHASHPKNYMNASHSKNYMNASRSKNYMKPSQWLKTISSTNTDIHSSGCQSKCLAETNSTDQLRRRDEFTIEDLVSGAPD